MFPKNQKQEFRAEGIIQGLKCKSKDQSSDPWNTHKCWVVVQKYKYVSVVSALKAEDRRPEQATSKTSHVSELWV